MIELTIDIRVGNIVGILNSIYLLSDSEFGSSLTKVMLINIQRYFSSS